MFIAIIGTRYSGKTAVEDYLVQSKGFTPVRLSVSNGSLENDSNSFLSGIESLSLSTDSPPAETTNSLPTPKTDSDVSETATTTPFVSMNASDSPESVQSARSLGAQKPALIFSEVARLLDHVTRNWRSDFVTSDLTTKKLLQTFLKRPFFLLISVDAPILDRFERSKSYSNTRDTSLEDFVRMNDGLDPAYGMKEGMRTVVPLHAVRHLVNLHIINSFKSLAAFYQHLDSLNLLDPNRLRPDWDTYFMTLASLASHRSNCMKRRVGAILVRDKRIVATGYNGTPRGVTNCNEGGCSRCNSGLESSGECLCLHAEENALLEAGRERVGEGAELYCNTCPCLKCTIKIIQTGVKEVIYNLSYKVDDASAKLFQEAGIRLRRHAPQP